MALQKPQHARLSPHAAALESRAPHAGLDTRAADTELDCIVITDHNTTRGALAVLEAVLAT